MSMYVTIQTEFNDLPSLVKALCEAGNWTEQQIELHQEAQNLYGYHGDKREQVANVIIRREHIGRSSNDIGFVKEDGKYKAIISEYDSGKFNKQWLASLKYYYSYHLLKSKLPQYGQRIQRTVNKNGRPMLTIDNYR
jgi:hypothetical protein